MVFNAVSVSITQRQERRGNRVLLLMLLVLFNVWNVDATLLTSMQASPPYPYPTSISCPFPNILVVELPQQTRWFRWMSPRIHHSVLQVFSHCTYHLIKCLTTHKYPGITKQRVLKKLLKGQHRYTWLLYHIPLAGDFWTTCFPGVMSDQTRASIWRMDP